MIRINHIYLILILCLLCIACKTETISPRISSGKEYLPLKANSIWIYDVDSVVYDSFSGEERNYHYELKDSIQKISIDTEGNTTAIISSFIRLDSNANWSFRKYHQLTVNNTRTLKTEDNYIYLKLVFPIQKDAFWNGNAYNNQTEETYWYSNIHISEKIASFNFDSVCTVIQKDVQNLIREEHIEEKYALNMGLVYKLVKFIDKDIYSQRITGGYIYTQKIKSYELH